MRVLTANTSFISMKDTSYATYSSVANLTIGMTFMLKADKSLLPWSLVVNPLTGGVNGVVQFFEDSWRDKAVAI